MHVCVSSVICVSLPSPLERDFVYVTARGTNSSTERMLTSHLSPAHTLQASTSSSPAHILPGSLKPDSAGTGYVTPHVPLMDLCVCVYCDYAIPVFSSTEYMYVFCQIEL